MLYNTLGVILIIDSQLTPTVTTSLSSCQKAMRLSMWNVLRSISGSVQQKG